MKRGNKVYWVIFGLCLIIMILAMLNETNIFYIVKNFIFSPEYRENFTLAESDVKTNISLFVVELLSVHGTGSEKDGTLHCGYCSQSPFVF